MADGCESGAAARLLCPIAKDSRIHADRPRHRGPDALLFGHSRPFCVALMGWAWCLRCERWVGQMAGGELLVAVSREPPKGPLCPIAKDSRIHADRPRHRGPDALLFGHSRPFLLGLWCRFKEMCVHLFEGERRRLLPKIKMLLWLS